MLNGDNNENGVKTNRSNLQNNKLHVQHTFCLSLAVVLHYYNVVLYD